ncbi:MAG: 3'(2'),5'-bisphosphate nucleotidase CysQ, partial [Euzebyales bacterium]|nr:3'(2'),5'-bisphosphate nucleotidase CysQ [Euzebyales bacterium]
RHAARVAAAAGALLLELRDRPDLAGKALRDEGDRRANERILALLAEAFPDDVVLSEESRDDPRRLQRERVWIVDPLDGTREYAEPGRSDWAVHVALVVNGRPVAGAVALPALGEVLATDPAPVLGAHRDGPPRMVVSRTRPPAVSEQVQAALGAELVPMGSAGAKTMAIVRGEADVYCHAGGQYEWDSAAPVAVAFAAGLHTSRLDGSPLRYNAPDPYLPDLLVCRPQYAQTVVAAASAGTG